MKLPPSARLALVALARLAVDGRVSVERRAELLHASGVVRGSWDRAVKALEGAGLVVIDRARPGESRPSCYRLTDEGLELARSLASSQDRVDRTSQVEPGLLKNQTSSNQNTLREETNNNRPSEPGSSQVGSSQVVAEGVARALLELAAAVREIGAAVREGRAARALTASPQGAPGMPDVPPPEPCPIHGPRVVVPRADGVRFWGCQGWRSDHHCGTATIGLEAHARAVLVARAATATEGARVDRQRAEREERARGRPKGRDYSALDASQIKAAGGVARVGDLLAGVVLRTSTDDGGQATRPEGG